MAPFETLLREYAQLTRPRIVLMVLFAMAVAAWCCGESPPSWLELLHALIGTALITAGSVAMNQWYERRSDALMARTQNRPLPAGRITPAHGLAFAFVASLSGLLYLFLFSSMLVAGVAVLSWIFYAACYTPLKSKTVWQLPVGAVAGAMPMLIGGAVVGSPLGTMTLSLFGVLFCWQFPHAVAIAWIYREHYARAGLQVASVRDPSGKLAGVLAVLGALALIAISLLPITVSDAGWLFGTTATSAGLVYLVLSIQFLRTRADRSARKVLWASFLYLPLYLLTLLAAT